jgi:hypothetical protein
VYLLVEYLVFLDENKRPLSILHKIRDSTSREDLHIYRNESRCVPRVQRTRTFDSFIDVRVRWTLKIPQTYLPRCCSLFYPLILKRRFC